MRDHNSSCVDSFDFKFIFSEIWWMLIESEDYCWILLLIVDLGNDTELLESFRDEMMHRNEFLVIICPELVCFYIDILWS